VALTLGACGAAEPAPDVIGQRLDLAESHVEDAGLEYEEIGGGAFGVVDRSNWTVCAQEPRAGRPAERVKLIVERVCERPRPAPSAAQESEPPGEVKAAEEAHPTDLVLGRLEGADYEVEEDEPGGGSPAAAAALQVELGSARARVLFYDSPADAQRAMRPFAAVEREQPDQIEVTRRRSTLYVGTIEEPAVLPTARYERLIEIAEGR